MLFVSISGILGALSLMLMLQKDIDTANIITNGVEFVNISYNFGFDYLEYAGAAGEGFGIDASNKNEELCHPSTIDHGINNSNGNSNTQNNNTQPAANGSGNGNGNGNVNGNNNNPNTSNPNRFGPNNNNCKITNCPANRTSFQTVDEYLLHIRDVHNR